MIATCLRACRSLMPWGTSKRRLFGIVRIDREPFCEPFELLDHQPERIARVPRSSRRDP
jgi:hypothetical protein